VAPLVALRDSESVLPQRTFLGGSPPASPQWGKPPTRPSGGCTPCMVPPGASGGSPKFLRWAPWLLRRRYNLVPKRVSRWPHARLSRSPRGPFWSYAGGVPPPAPPKTSRSLSLTLRASPISVEVPNLEVSSKIPAHVHLALILSGFPKLFV